MIRRECLQDEHIVRVARARGIKEVPLLGRMIHALYLVEQLHRAGLLFTFKGGTCLSLILGRLDRLSIDVDIEVSTDVSESTIESALNSITSAGSVFTRWEPDVRTRDVEGSKHYKIFYQQDVILLDIVRTAVPYDQTIERVLDHEILVLEGDPVRIVTPTVEGILGDKLTACAPLTVGVPLEVSTLPGTTLKYNKYLEMIKQLFDVNVLIPRVRDWDSVGAAFTRTLEVQRNVFGYEFTPTQVVDDLVRRALAMFGQLKAVYHPELTTSHQKGHRSLGNFVVDRGSFGFEHVKLSALRAAYVVSCVSKRAEPSDQFPDIARSSLDGSRIKEICKGLPNDLKTEAVAVVEILLRESKHGAQ